MGVDAGFTLPGRHVQRLAPALQHIVDQRHHATTRHQFRRREGHIHRDQIHRHIACERAGHIADAAGAAAGAWGIGIAPGANISDQYACFEATHGTAPKYAGLDKVNPGSLILSAEMMLRHLGWIEAADLVIRSMEAAIGDKQVTYDFARLMEGADELSCSAFGDAMIARM